MPGLKSRQCEDSKATIISEATEGTRLRYTPTDEESDAKNPNTSVKTRGNILKCYFCSDFFLQYSPVHKPNIVHGDSMIPPAMVNKRTKDQSQGQSR